MAKKKTTDERSASELVSYLRARLETIFLMWRIQCEADPRMASKSSFSREEFNDQAPLLLEILIARLAGDPEPGEPGTVAGEHGLHRWQSGYTLPELIREIEHLFNCVLNELQTFEKLNSELDPEILTRAYREVFRIYGEANRGSPVYYYQLMQNVAIERANSLGFTLGQLQELGQKRGEHLRQSSHDLRASFGILMAASRMLEMPTKEQERVELLEMLNRNLGSIKEMLLQLTDFARIESGQDEVVIQKFDAVALIRDTIETARPMAKQYNLHLLADGPEVLEVTSDRVKVQRILNNLLYNALKYTRKGGIHVSWGMESSLRWTLSIQDTGPGFTPNSPAALLAEQLKPALSTTASHQDTPLFRDLPPAQAENPDTIKESEGLGLFIVKKLCEQLRAAMGVESTPGTGTLIRIRFAMDQQNHPEM